MRILNGGWGAWLNAGLPVDETESVLPLAKSLDMNPTRKNIITRPTQVILDHEHGTSQIVDTRNSNEYQTYHIPQAINVPSTLLMQDGIFATVKQIRDCIAEKDLKVDDVSPIILYSNQGLTASTAYFCLTLAGIDRATVYDQGLCNWVSNKNDWEMVDADIFEDHWRK